MSVLQVGPELSSLAGSQERWEEQVIFVGRVYMALSWQQEQCFKWVWRSGLAWPGFPLSQAVPKAKLLCSFNNKGRKEVTFECCEPGKPACVGLVFTFFASCRNGRRFLLGPEALAVLPTYRENVNPGRCPLSRHLDYSKMQTFLSQYLFLKGRKQRRVRAQS